MEFTTDIFPVPEDNGTINICLRTNIGSQEELVINVMATVKTTGSDLACKIVCVLLKYVVVIDLTLPLFSECCLKLLSTLFLGRLPSLFLQVQQDRCAACASEYV